MHIYIPSRSKKKKERKKKFNIHDKLKGNKIKNDTGL